jgi:hypothetical protein
MKLNPGDIVEIETPGGNAYVQVTHNHASYPETVRVLAGRHQKRPEDFDVLVRSKSDFVAMLTLAGAMKNKRMKAEKVGSAAVPPEHKAFPTFRMPIRDKQGGIAYWWLWDGEGLSYVTELDEKTSDLPMREVMSINTFMEKLG